MKLPELSVLGFVLAIGVVIGASLRPAVPPPMTAASPRADEPEAAPAAMNPGPGTGATTPWGDRFDRPLRTMPEFTPEFIDACLEVAADINQTLAKQLRELRAEHPAQFERKLRHTRRLIDLTMVRQRDRSLYGLKLAELRVDAEVNRLVKEIRRARAEGRPKIAARRIDELRMQVRAQLAFEHTNRGEYLCRLQELVQRLEQEWEAERRHFSEHFDEIVEARIAQLVGDDDAGLTTTNLAPPAE